jgi:hypothetical protein
MNTTTDRHDTPATASEIRELIGAEDDEIVTSILALGATSAEILEAQAWLGSDDYLHRELQHALSGRAAAVFEILEAELADPDRP